MYFSISDIGYNLLIKVCLFIRDSRLKNMDLIRDVKVVFFLNFFNKVICMIFVL